METQKSVHAWIAVTFPEWSGSQGRALAIIEEAVELGLAANLSPEQIQSAVDLSVGQAKRRAEAGTPVEADEGEVADIQLNLWAYAEERGFSAQDAVDKKMAKNRLKPLEQYRAKTKLKRELGLQLPVCSS